MKHLSPTSTASRGSVVALAALAVLVGVGGGAAAVELHASSTPVPSAAAAMTLAQAASPAVPRTDGFDPATCLAPARTPAAGASGTEDQASGRTVVSFTVPPMTRVTVDAEGAPLAVATNTGQAPCTTDTFVLIRPDGTAVPATDDVRDAVLRLHLGGEWPPGVARPLPAQR